MSWPSTRPARGLVGSLRAIAFLLVASAAHGQSGSFKSLAGSWSGSGIVKLTEGGSERIKCKAIYQLADRSTVTLRLTCASDTYKIALSGTMHDREGAIAGSWSESTRKVEGMLSGRVRDNKIVLKTSGVIPRHPHADDHRRSPERLAPARGRQGPQRVDHADTRRGQLTTSHPSGLMSGFSASGGGSAAASRRSASGSGSWMPASPNRAAGSPHPARRRHRGAGSRDRGRGREADGGRQGEVGDRRD